MEPSLLLSFLTLTLPYILWPRPRESISQSDWLLFKLCVYIYIKGTLLCISHQTSFSLFIGMKFNIGVCFTALLLLCTVVTMSTASSRCYKKNCAESFHACFSQCETVEHCQNCLILKFNFKALLGFIHEYISCVVLPSFLSITLTVLWNQF